MSHFIYPSKEYDSRPEIYKSYRGRFALTGTLSDEGVELNEYGRKVVVKGTFVDKDGKISSLSGGTGGDPVGLVDSSHDVTDGPREVAIVTEAHLIGKRLNFGEQEYDEAKGTQIETAIPGLRIYPRPPRAAAGAGAAAAPTTVDLSKATGTLAVEHGGTGATSADSALEALGGQKKLSDPLPIANGGTGATSASEALDAILESQPLPITKGGTGASDKDTAVTNLGAQKAE